RRCRAHRGTCRSRSWRHRIRDRRPYRPPALLRRERAFQFRGRSGARRRLQSLPAACGLPHRGGATPRSELQRAGCRGRGPAVTERIELMVAVRPTFHLPALLGKQAANIDRISNGRLTLNVVSSWWADEARKYGVAFEQHDDRYARTSEWLDVLDGVWKQDHFSYSGKYYRVDDNVLEPKPVAKPRPTLYAG